jgi:hypothetical protein
MFGEEKNLKDTNSPLPNLPLSKGEELGGGLSYKKTQKLITALYMVTDIIDRDEPLRNKLRTLGTGIISDMYSAPLDAYTKIAEIMSFLDIAYTLNIISEMNCNILRKEFTELSQSIKQSTNKVEILNKQISLAEFFEDSPEEESDPYPTSPLVRGRSKEGVLFQHRGRENSKGHTRIGVQKGSTLLKALSGVSMSRSSLSSVVSHAEDFYVLKKQREDSIIKVIKVIGGGATIKDIKDKVKTMSVKDTPLVLCGEKTLQRELLSMVKNGVLYKTGEKRWSKYFIK